MENEKHDFGEWMDGHDTAIPSLAIGAGFAVAGFVFMVVAVCIGTITGARIGLLFFVGGVLTGASTFIRYGIYRSRQRFRQELLADLERKLYSETARKEEGNG